MSSVPRKSLFLTLALGLFLCRIADAQASGGGVSLAGVGHHLGDSAARVLIVEFGDFGCGYCARFNVETFPKIASAYVNNGIVRWKMIPYASNAFPHSREVSEAAECAGEQGAFWKMHDLLYLKRREWMVSKDLYPLVTSYATRLNLDTTEFARCLANPEIQKRIELHDSIAHQLSLRGTPMFFINGRLVQGAVPYEMFQQLIAKAAR